MTTQELEQLVMTHYIIHYIKTQQLHSRNHYNRLSDLYDSVKPLVEPLFNFQEGIAKVNQLKATYPELDFELKPLGD
jgi:hypothetical protein